MSRVVKISKRLSFLAELVEGNFVADIGCDHGYLSIYLAANKNIKIYACDFRKRPLERAKENAKKFGVFEKIDFLLCDGLKKVPFFVDCVVIAGMGGRLIERIVFESRFIKNKNVKLILQPQSFLFELRKNLALKGFEIEKEIHFFEKGKCYDILSVRFNGKKEKLRLKEAVLGKKLGEENIYTKKFLRKRILKEEGILKGLKKAKNLNFERIKEREEILKILFKYLEKI